MLGKTISHYRILEKLGEGGMGVVYKAEDTKLCRAVAIKMLPQSLGGNDEAKRRFIQEAKAASALDHPNICTIHEIDETKDGRIFMVMALCEGRTVKERIAQGPLDIARAVDIAIGVARGLERAHERGIVHRDIKPANIMVTNDGAVKIMDFGIAKLVGEATITRTGSSIGTVAYMSPEQASGRTVDHRTDIWSLGVLLYEMLTGRRPFGGDYDQSIVYAIMNDAPQPPAILRCEIPSDLEQVAMKAMAKNPAERYQSTREMQENLEACARSIDAGARPATGAKRQQLPSIAVLPFVNLSHDHENEYFSDGLAEDIIDALANVPGLRVMARTSAFSFRGKEADIREIGARLGVEHILEGSVRRAGNRLRVTAQLVKASDGYHLWSQRFDREMTDVFAIQDEISQAIVEKLRVRLVADRALVKRYTENMAAYDLCLKARYHLMKVAGEGYELARQYCEQAIALDPDYAPAHVVLSECFMNSAYWGFTKPGESLPRAKSAALEALRLDDSIAEAHSAMGVILGAGEFDWRRAEGEFRRALELNPSSAIARYWYGHWFLLPLGRVEEALAEERRALESDPLDAFYNSQVGYLLHATRQFEAAVTQLKHAIELDPAFFESHWLLSITYALVGRIDEAIAEAEKANELSGGIARTMGLLGRAYGLAGRTTEARRLLEELEARRRSSHVPPSSIAMIHRGLGDLEKSMEWWARGAEEHDLLLVMSLQAEPGYDAVRSHSAYRALLRKMNLEP